MKILKLILISPLLLIVKIYQLIISPLFPATCRYNPTCSHYMIESLQEWGIVKGSWLGIKRIAKCNPRGGFGDDPVPKRNKI
jgi:putative membrane protein insertion efficiency factor